MLEGLRKIEGSKNCYASADGRVFSLKEIKPYQKGSKFYYRLKGEDGSKIYYSVSVAKNATENAEIKKVVKSATETITAPKRHLTEEEVSQLIF